MTTQTQDHQFQPLRSGWGHSECKRCGLRYRPRMQDSRDVAWLRSMDAGKTWSLADGPSPACVVAS